jgi:hypothetical protein
MSVRNLADVLQYVNELDEQYQREQKQAILQRNMDKAVSALAGQEACERLRSWLTMRTAMADNVAVMTSKKARG